MLHVYFFLSIFINLLFTEYDHYLEMVGIPWLTFLKEGKCARCTRNNED